MLNNNIDELKTNIEKRYDVIEDFVLSLSDKETILKYNPPPNSLANKVKISEKEHILLCGKIQSGKCEETLELTLKIITNNKKHVIILLRNNNSDLDQIDKRIKEFNNLKRSNNQPELPIPRYLLSETNNLKELLLNKNRPELLFGLSNVDCINMINKTIDTNPELKNTFCVINDEADLFAFELKADSRTKTENALNNTFDKCYCYISITATPLPLILREKISQIYSLNIPNNYYGINNLTHINIPTPFVNIKNKIHYNNDINNQNIDDFYQHILQNEESTALINIKKSKKDHKKIIKYISKNLSYNNSDLIFLELNDKSVKIYNNQGNLIDQEIYNKISNKYKVASINQAIQKYIKTKYIIIVGGILAGRGISFVSESYKRHLTHQYIIKSPTSHMACLYQSIRLCGKYNDNPNLYLFCDDNLFNELLTYDKEIDNFIDKIKNGKLDDVIQIMNKQPLISNRQQNGTDFKYIVKSNQYQYELRDQGEQGRQNRFTSGNIQRNLLKDILDNTLMSKNTYYQIVIDGPPSLSRFIKNKKSKEDYINSKKTYEEILDLIKIKYGCNNLDGKYFIPISLNENDSKNLLKRQSVMI